MGKMGKIFLATCRDVCRRHGGQISQIDTDLETKKLKRKTQNQNSKLKTTDRKTDARPIDFF
jgi:hypothetical protein